MRTVNSLFVAILLAAGMFACLAIENLSGYRESRSRPSAVLGVTFGQRPGEKALVVDSIKPNGPADRAGLEVGDAVEALEGHTEMTVRALDRDVVQHQDIDFDVKRGTNSVHIRISKEVGKSIGQQDPVDRGRSVDV